MDVLSFWRWEFPLCPKHKEFRQKKNDGTTGSMACNFSSFSPSTCQKQRQLLVSGWLQEDNSVVKSNKKKTSKQTLCSKGNVQQVMKVGHLPKHFFWLFLMEKKKIQIFQVSFSVFFWTRCFCGRMQPTKTSLESFVKTKNFDAKDDTNFDAKKCQVRYFRGFTSVTSLFWSPKKIRRTCRRFKLQISRSFFSSLEMTVLGIDKRYWKTEIFTLQGMFTYPTLGKRQNHRLKSAGWYGIC